MSVQSVTEVEVITARRDALSPHKFREALEQDEHEDHLLTFDHNDYEGDGEPLYLDVDGFFDLDDDFEPGARALSARLLS